MCDSILPPRNGWGIASILPPPGAHYDFIEAGTSDWGTITHGCSGDMDNASCVSGLIRTSLCSLRDARGLAVEPMSEYLDNLPSLPRVKKVLAALGEHGGV